MRRWWLPGLCIAAACLACGIALIPGWRATAFGISRREPFVDGRPVSFWSEALRSQNAADYGRATNVLSSAGAVAVPILVGDLQDEDPLFRMHLSTALARIGAPAVPELVGALEHANPYVRAGAARALGEIGPAARAAIPALITELTDQYRFVVLASATALQRIGSDSIGPLCEALRDRDNSERIMITGIFGRMGADAGDAAPALSAALTDSDANLRGAAAEALAAIGPPAKASIPALTRALDDAEPRVRLYAAAALWEVQREPDLPVRCLLTLVKTGSRPTRLLALRELQDMGPAAKSAVAIVRAACSDPDVAVVVAAKRALQKIDPAVK
jgi:HEAT repeat protein